jgi:heat shock protein HtpX
MKNLTKMKALSKLRIVCSLTLSLIFGLIAGIFALLLLYSGASGSALILQALLFSLIFIFIQWYIGPGMIKLLTRMREIKEEEYPWLHSMVNELSREAGIPKPRLYLVQDLSPNAFAFGRTQGSAGIGVHLGLIRNLEKEEIRGVIAHEIAHIKHRDMIVMTIASALPIVLYFLVIALAPRREEERASLAILIYFGAIVARMIGQLVVLWLSRVREYFADSYSAYATKEPASLASALVKISQSAIALRPSRQASALRAFYIADPFTKAGELEPGMEQKFLELFMTHPLVFKRIKNLKRIEEELKSS